MEHQTAQDNFGKIKIIAVLLMFLLITITGCTESNRVRQNISKEADNFNVIRRVAVINTVSGKPIFEIIGRMSVIADKEDEQLEIIVEVADGEYKKHIVGLNKATTMYVVEDISGAKVSKYKYEINYIPESIQPFTVTTSE